MLPPNLFVALYIYFIIQLGNNLIYTMDDSSMIVLNCNAIASFVCIMLMTSYMHCQLRYSMHNL